MKIINVTTMVFQWQNVVLSPRSGLQPDLGVRVNPKETPQPTQNAPRAAWGFVLVVGLQWG